jgi:IS1 family transposase
LPGELAVGDCWIGTTIATDSGLILSLRVGKHTDEFLAELVCSTEGKTACDQWRSDGWGAYERVLPEWITLWVGKAGTQKIERTNGILRGQTGRWQRRQHKFGKVWEQTEVSARLIVSYFNWIWKNSWTKTTAAERAGLAIRAWSWDDFAIYSTLL